MGVYRNFVKIPSIFGMKFQIISNDDVRKIIAWVVDHNLSTNYADNKFDVIFQELVPDIDRIVRQF
ncbi:MAG: hypothetical protein ACOCZJ_03765 [Thermoplasmatota archaeon]